MLPRLGSKVKNFVEKGVIFGVREFICPPCFSRALRHALFIVLALSARVRYTEYRKRETNNPNN
jgi:hypothetical protein